MNQNLCKVPAPCQSPPQDTHLASAEAGSWLSPTEVTLSLLPLKIHPPWVVPSTHREIKAISLLIEEPQVMVPPILSGKSDIVRTRTKGLRLC